MCRTDGERLPMITQPGATTHAESQLQIVLTEHASRLHPYCADDAQTTRIEPPCPPGVGSAPMSASSGGCVINSKRRKHLSGPGLDALRDEPRVVDLRRHLSLPG